MTPRSLRRTTRWLRGVVVVASLLFSLAACEQPKTERERLIEASALARSGEPEAARAIYLSLVAAPDATPAATLRYAAFLIDTGDLDGAADVLSALGDGLDGADLERYEEAWRRLHTERRERGFAERFSAPEAQASYEAGLTGLIALDAHAQHVAELADYLREGAYSALGEPHVGPADIEATVARASESQVTRALTYLDRLVEGDPRCPGWAPPDDDALAAALALREALLVARFEDEFFARWSTRFRDAFLRDGRFDASSRRFIVRHEAPLRDGVSWEQGRPKVEHELQTWQARAAATALAYELLGPAGPGAERAAPVATPDPSAPPLPFEVADFVTTTVHDVERLADDTVRARIEIPWDVVVRGAWMLRLRLDAAHAGDAETETP